MAELNAILAKITEASREKSEAIRARAELEWDKLDAQADANREAWRAGEYAKLQWESDAAYTQRRAALEQEFKKKLLQDRRFLVNDAMDTLSVRLQNCSKDEFIRLLIRALAEIPSQDPIQVQFGANAPAEKWKGWIEEHMQGDLTPRSVGFLPKTIAEETGFVLRSGAVSYRLVGMDIANQFLEEKGGEIEKRLFAGGAEANGDRT